MKKCPYCAEQIQDESIVCMHCGRDLTAPQPTRKKARPGITLLIGVGLLVLSFGLGAIDSKLGGSNSKFGVILVSTIIVLSFFAAIYFFIISIIQAVRNHKARIQR